MRRITIFDTTLRDGDQAAGMAFLRNAKPPLALALADAGVDIIETGFPLSSDADFYACRETAAALRGNSTAKAAMMCRAHAAEIRRTANILGETGVLHITLPVSDSHIAAMFNAECGIRNAELNAKCKVQSVECRVMQANISITEPQTANSTLYTLHSTLNRTPHSELLKLASKTVAFASEQIPMIEIGAEDASRAEIDFLCDYCETVIEAGASIVNIADTLGILTPPQMKSLIQTLRKRVSGFASAKAKLSVHCHNDFGLAAANTLAAIEAGCDQIETTVGGIGERAGNAALEEIAAVLASHKETYHAVTGIRLEELDKLTAKVCVAVGISLGPMKPLSGWNVHAHASGIHQKGMAISENNYSAETVRISGKTPERIVLSRHSGKAGVYLAAKQYGLGSLTDNEAERILERIKQSNTRTVGVTEFYHLAAEEHLLPPDIPIPLFCTAYAEYHYDNYNRVMATLSDRRAVVGEGITAEDAILDAIREFSGLTLSLSRVELNGRNGQYRLYAEIAIPDETTLSNEATFSDTIISLAAERHGTIPGRLLFECCLDAVNQTMLKKSAAVYA